MSQPSPAVQPSAVPQVSAIAALGEADLLVTALRNRTYELASENMELRDLTNRQAEAIEKLRAEIEQLSADKNEKAK